jgi:hypothetical protein
MSQFDRAAASTVCDALIAGGSALIGSGISTIAAGGAGIVPLTAGLASVFAGNYACGPTPIGENPEAPPGNTSGCIKADGGSFPIHISPDGGEGGAGFVGYNYTEILSVEELGGAPEGFENFRITALHLDGNPRISEEFRSKGTTYSLRLGDGVNCLRDADTLPAPPTDYTAPIEYTDPETNCTMIVTQQGFVSAGEGQPVRPVMKIEAAPAPGALTSGGVVGGCNFSPIIYVGGGGGGEPPTTAPWDPDWPDQPTPGTPPWVDLVSDTIGGIIANIITTAIIEYFRQPVPQYQYTMRAACNYKQDGSYETYTITLPEQPWDVRVLAMQEMNTDFLQQHLLWKTPTCSGTPQPITGDPVTINWVSDEYSTAGNDRIRKLFTYFDQVGSTLEQTVAHWRDFSWQAGSVIVSVKGVPLGKPQVWAASSDEGKRVINHAAAIAGVDMTNAEWMFGSPRSSRYGETGTMRVHRGANGALGITKRDGPSGSPPALG